MSDESTRDDERVLFEGAAGQLNDDGDENRLVARLRCEGILGPPRRKLPSAARWIAAAALFVAGVLTGAYASPRGSLEMQLDRTNLSADERASLLDRAGSAYARATEIYIAGETAGPAAEATKTVRVLWF